MSDIEPANGIQIARALSTGIPITDRLTRTHARLFDGNAEIQALYVDVFDALVAEGETVPGYGVAMSMMLERYAFLFAAQKANDALAVPLDPRDYDKLILRFRQLWDGLLKARDDRQADDQFKHAFITAFMRAFQTVCDELLEPDKSTEIQNAVVRKLQTIEVQGTETRRRNRS